MYLLQLHRDHSGSFFEINDVGAVVSTQRITDFSLVPKINPQEILIVLFPGDRVTMTSVKLPKMRESERIKAIPFTLEEQLATDTDTLFFLSGKAEADGSLPVAVVEKLFLDDQIAALQSANLNPHMLLPDFMGLSLEPAAWSVYIENNIAMVRLNEVMGFTIDASNLFLFLQLALEKNTKPDRILFFQKDTVVDVTQFEKLNVPVFVRDQVCFDANSFASHHPFNFLTGKNKPKSQSSHLERNWMICGVTAIVLVASLFFGHIAEWLYLKHQSTVLEKQVLTAYQALFPGAREVLEPHFRTQKLLSEYQQASKGSTFLKLLSAAGKALASSPDVQLTAVKYDQDALTLSVETKTEAQLNQWISAMQSLGLIATQRSSGVDNAMMTADIVVKARS